MTIIDSLQGTEGIIHIHDSGINDRFQWIVIDLLGLSLDKYAAQKNM